MTSAFLRQSLLALASLVLLSPSGAALQVNAQASANGKGVSIPLSFEANEGQLAPDVRYFARYNGMFVLISADELALSFHEREPRKRDDGPRRRFDRQLEQQRELAQGVPTTVRMRLKGARRDARIVATEPLLAKTHYLIGNDPAKWRRDVTNYKSVRIEGVYAGIDFVLHGEKGSLEYDFVVAPGADPGQIELEFQGARETLLSPEGDLILKTDRGEVRHGRPLAQETTGGDQRSLSAQFEQHGNTMRLRVPGRDPSKRLVIDPTIGYWTEFGGALEDGFVDVAADLHGNTYAVGFTKSTPNSFDAFLTKFDQSGVVVFTSFIGGNSIDGVSSVAVDEDGRPSVAGATFSTDFPAVNAVQPSLGGSRDGFVARLKADGTGFEYSTYYGGNSDDSLASIALDPTGAAWVAGRSSSSALTFQTPGAYQGFTGGNCGSGPCSDMLVARFSAVGSITFGTHLGFPGQGSSSHTDFASGIAADEAGNAYLVGRMGSTAPTGRTGYSAKIDASGVMVGSWLSLVDLEAVAVDRQGRAYIVSTTHLPNLITTSDAAQPVHGGEFDVFLRRFSAEWTADGPKNTEYATYLGGPRWEEGWDVSVDLLGNMYVSYQITDQSAPDNSSNMGFAKISATGQIGYTEELGAPQRHDDPFAVAVDVWGNAYLVGEWNRNVQAGNIAQALLVRFDGAFEDIEPSCQDECHDVAKPINIYTGNVWLNQTDAAIGGVMGIGFTRSYNSQGNREPIRTELGMGWTHSFDRSVVLMPDGRLRFRHGSGAPMYFTWSAAESKYKASAPASERSTFKKIGTIWERSFPDGSKETYDERGRLTVIQDIVGNTLTLSRQTGSLTVADPGGRSLVLVYDGVGRLTELTGQGQTLATYAYGTNGQLDAVSYPDGTGYRYEYDDRGQLLRMGDASGHVVETHTYDGDKGISSEVAGGQERFTIVYETGRTLVTDALGNTATYEFQAIGGINKVTRRTGPCASCAGQESEEWTYTAEGRVETHKDGAGRITRYTYESDGDLASETIGHGTPLARTTTYTWDAQSRPLTRMAPGEGTREWTDYVAAGPQTVRVPMDATRTRISTTVYNPTPAHPNQLAGTIASVTDADGRQTEYSYFEGGGIHGDLEWIEDAREYRTFFGYDVLGRKSQVTDANGNATQTEYDLLGRVKKVTQTVGQAPSAVTLETVFTYNNRGLKESVRDPEGRTTRYTYDDFGRLQSVIDDHGNTTIYDYDVMSRLTSITNARGKTWRFAYDAYGRLTSTTWPGTPARTETLRYYADGQVHTRTDRRNVTTTYTYDELGRLRTKSCSNGTPTITYSYDVAGRLESVLEGPAASPSQLVTRQYLLSGELSQETQTRGSTTGTLDYDYFLSGRRQTIKVNGQNHLQYGYDGDVLLSLTHGTRVFSVGLDPATRRYVLGHPNNLLTEYKYDEANRLLSVKFGTGTVDTQNLAVNFTTVLGQTVYTYDKSGNRTSKTALDHAESYDYDDLHRLTYASRTGAGARTWSYDYDEVGNLSGQVKAGLPAGGGQPTSAGALNVSYSDRNELENYAAGGKLAVRGAISEPGTVGVYTAATGELAARMVGQEAGVGFLFEADVAVNSGTNSFEIRARDTANHLRTSQYTVNIPADNASFMYDNNGNLVSRTDSTGAWGYEWNAENQLVRVTLNSAEVARFTYDPLGRRVEKVAAGITASWLYDGDDILQETITGGPSAGVYQYLHGPGIDEPLARIQNPGPSETLTYYHADGLGSIIATTSQAGAIVSTRRYDAWGNLEVGATEPGYAFTGREWDPETGLYYYRARYYDPKVGRFISEDPIGFGGGVNFFGYVEGNPVNQVDPMGLAVYKKPDPPTPPTGSTSTFDWFIYDLRSRFGGHNYNGNPALDAMGMVGPMGVGVVAGKAAGGVVMHAHHVLPKLFRESFRNAGINIDKFLVRIPRQWHLKWVHGAGARGGRWNKAWDEFFKENPNRTAEEIWDQLAKMLDEIGLCPPD